MRAIPADSLDFTPIPGEMPRGRLILGTHEVELSGVWMRAAFALDSQDPVSGYLFITNNDITFEEVLTITLTDLSLRVLDRAWIGAPYNTMLLTDATIVGPGCVDLEIVDEGTFQVTVLPRPRWHLPLPAANTRIWRGTSLRRHFKVRRIKDPS